MSCVVIEESLRVGLEIRIRVDLGAFDLDIDAFTLLGFFLRIESLNVVSFIR